MKHWNDHSIVKSGSSAECHTFSVNRGLVNTYDKVDKSVLYTSTFLIGELYSFAITAEDNNPKIKADLLQIFIITPVGSETKNRTKSAKKNITLIRWH